MNATRKSGVVGTIPFNKALDHSPIRIGGGFAHEFGVMVELELSATYATALSKPVTLIATRSKRSCWTAAVPV
jgi:CO/xanthine dehydrogenase Mo-binding subunit